MRTDKENKKKEYEERKITLTDKVRCTNNVRRTGGGGTISTYIESSEHSQVEGHELQGDDAEDAL